MSLLGTAKQGVGAPAMGVVLNRVARARAVFARLRDIFGPSIATGKVAERFGVHAGERTRVLIPSAGVCRLGRL